MFDAVVASILAGDCTNEETKQQMAGLKENCTGAETRVIAFLDMYFKGASVESAPDATGVHAGNCYMRLVVIIICYLFKLCDRTHLDIDGKNCMMKNFYPSKNSCLILLLSTMNSVQFEKGIARNIRNTERF